MPVSDSDPKLLKQIEAFFVNYQKVRRSSRKTVTQF